MLRFRYLIPIGMLLLVCINSALAFNNIPIWGMERQLTHYAYPMENYLFQFEAPLFACWFFLGAIYLPLTISKPISDRYVFGCSLVAGVVGIAYDYLHFAHGFCEYFVEFIGLFVILTAALRFILIKRCRTMVTLFIPSIFIINIVILFLYHFAMMFGFGDEIRLQRQDQFRLLMHVSDRVFLDECQRLGDMGCFILDPSEQRSIHAVGGYDDPAIAAARANGILGASTYTLKRLGENRNAYWWIAYAPATETRAARIIHDTAFTLRLNFELSIYMNFIYIWAVVFWTIIAVLFTLKHKPVYFSQKGRDTYGKST